jgi:hypothetical protein
MSFRNKSILLIIFFLVELILKSSGIDIFSNIELLIIGIVIIEELQGRDFGIYLVFLLFSIILEAVSFELVAMRGFILTLVYLMVNLIFVNFKGLANNKDLKILIIIILSISMVSVFRSYELMGSVNLNLLGLLGNLFLYIIIYKIINKLAPSRYVI